MITEITDLDIDKMPMYFGSKREIATFFKASYTTLDKWLTHPLFPKKTEDGYLSEEVMKVWHSKRESDKNQDLNGGGGSSELKDEKLRNEIEILQLRIDQIKGEWILYADHNRELVELASVAKRAFTDTPQIMAAKGFAPDVVDAVRRECDDALNRMRSDIKELPNE